jgi:hypothetical protein
LRLGLKLEPNLDILPIAPAGLKKLKLVKEAIFLFEENSSRCDPVGGSRTYITLNEKFYFVVGDLLVDYLRQNA